MAPDSTNARIYQSTMDMVRELRPLLGFTTLQATFEFIVKEEFNSPAVFKLRANRDENHVLLLEATGK
jgi:hypothetical protein